MSQMPDTQNRSICPHCGQPHTSGLKFCPFTGKPLPPFKPTCPSCGREVQEKWARCPYCAAFLRPIERKHKPYLWGIPSRLGWLLGLGFFLILLTVGWIFQDQIRSGVEFLLAFLATPAPVPTWTIIPNAELETTTITPTTTTKSLTSLVATITTTITPSQIATRVPIVPKTPTQTLIPSVTPQPASPAVPTGIKICSGNILVSNYVNFPLEIDGILDEWDLPAYPVTEVVYGKANYQGAIDLSASVMLSWDEKYLYLALRVKDDRYIQNVTGDELYKGDHIEILLDNELDGDYADSTLSADDHQLGLSLGSDLHSPENYHWFPRAMQGSHSDVVIAGLPTKDGYDVEAAIPWQLFRVTPSLGQVLGFALSVSDNDQVGENVQETMVSTAPNRHLTNPTTWGNLYLVKTASFATIFNFLACMQPCLEDGSNTTRNFPEKTIKVYAQWAYKNIPIGAHYVRSWTMNGQEWVRYDCSWPGPENGTDRVTLSEPKGLHSGIWEVTISVDRVVLLQEQITVQGNWTYWDPAGYFDTCYGQHD